MNDNELELNTLDFYKHLRSILCKAQGVIDKETHKTIDIGQEVANLRIIIDDLMLQVYHQRKEIHVLKKSLEDKHED